MKHPASLDDFPIGCTVKVTRLPRHGLYSPSWIGRIGMVWDWRKDNDVWGEWAFSEGERGPWVIVDFGEPCDDLDVHAFRPWWLQRGRMEFVPDEVSA